MQLQVIYTKTFESLRLFQKKTLNSTQAKGATLLDTKEQSCKQGVVGASGTGGITMVLTLLTEVVAFHVKRSIIKTREPTLQLFFSVAGKFGTTGLGLEEKIHAELCHPLEVFLGISSRSRERDWSIRNWSIQRAYVA